MADFKVLHIDDDEAIRRIVAKVLNVHGSVVTSQSDPRQAISDITREHFRVVILDIDMPVLNGIDVLRSIKAYDGGSQVVMFCPYDFGSLI